MKDKKLADILGRKKNWKGQLMVPLNDMEILLENGGNLAYKNKKVGTCFCHMVNYEGREFFEVTGDEVVYRVVKNQFVAKSKYNKTTYPDI